LIRVVEVVGARPNFVKIGPLHAAMKSASLFDISLVHTGQHYDREMSEAFLRDLGLPEPSYELGVGSGTHAEQTAQVMLRLEPHLARERPDLVVVVGDVNSTLGAALTAVQLQIPLAHVEAGLRSQDRTMPEEINRLVTDAISDLLFAPSRDAVDDLLREGIDERKIHLVGNVMIDSLDSLIRIAHRSTILGRLGLTHRDFLLATLHRPSNVDEDASLQQVVEVLASAASFMPLVFVAHPRTQKRLKETGLDRKLHRLGIRVLEPLGYVDFLKLMSAAAGVVTDSGGIQEETTVLGIPCLTVRDTTERPVTVTEGTNQVVGLDIERITKAVAEIARGDVPKPRRPELWDGHAAERIVAVLEREFG
jgi:UDP-N-acetylglucosamine 2-epimerase (non-hydrolysing)